jgi:hypothetical protein
MEELGTQRPAWHCILTGLGIPTEKSLAYPRARGGDIDPGTTISSKSEGPGGSRSPGGRPTTLMSILEHLPPQARKELREVGWTKGLELAKVARRDRPGFDCATWLHKARLLPKDQFKLEAEKS